MEPELILLGVGLPAFIILLIGLPATYGVLLRQDADADWDKLPSLLRFVYTVDLKKERDKRGWLSKHPEMLSLGAVVLICGYLAWQMLLSMLEVNEQTGELQIDTTGVDATILFLVSFNFWWAAITFGTEWWLERKWLPKHMIRDEAEQ